jgi:hypothetical protein
MRANAPVIRSAQPPRPVGRTVYKRSMHDTKAFFYCMMAGLLLASYAHDPNGVEAMARQARSNFQQVTAHMTPTGFQTFLTSLAQT